MKILLVAKCDYSGLAEGMARAFAGLEHTVELFDLRRYRRRAKYLGAGWVSRRLQWRLESFQPQLVFVVAPLFLAPAHGETLADYRHRSGALCAGWIGDSVRIRPETPQQLAAFDRLYITDSGFAPQLPGFSTAYLPLATDPEIFRPAVAGRMRRNCVFVAAHTANRERFLRQTSRTVEIFGPGWKGPVVAGLGHPCHGGKVSLLQTSRLYSESRFVLNLKNADNVLNGLNQRSFDPCACRIPLLHDWVMDLERNFEPGNELLVFKSAAEFDAHYDRLCNDPEFGARIADNGLRRILASHTFRHRAETVLEDLQLARSKR